MDAKEYYLRRKLMEDADRQARQAAWMQAASQFQGAADKFGGATAQWQQRQDQLAKEAEAKRQFELEMAFQKNNERFKRAQQLKDEQRQAAARAAYAAPSADKAMGGLSEGIDWSAGVEIGGKPVTRDEAASAMRTEGMQQVAPNIAEPELEGILAGIEAEKAEAAAKAQPKPEKQQTVKERMEELAKAIQAEKNVLAPYTDPVTGFVILDGIEKDSPEDFARAKTAMRRIQALADESFKLSGVRDPDVDRMLGIGGQPKNGDEEGALDAGAGAKKKAAPKKGKVGLVDQALHQYQNFEDWATGRSDKVPPKAEPAKKESSEVKTRPEWTSVLGQLSNETGIDFANPDSGFRTKLYNEEVGGKDDSYHLEGLASDHPVGSLSAEQRKMVVEKAKQLGLRPLIHRAKKKDGSKGGLHLHLQPAPGHPLHIGQRKTSSAIEKLSKDQAKAMFLEFSKHPKMRQEIIDGLNKLKKEMPDADDEEIMREFFDSAVRR